MGMGMRVRGSTPPELRRVDNFIVSMIPQLQIQTTTDRVVFILKISIQEHPCSSNLPLFKDHYRQHAKIISFILDKKCSWNLEKIGSRYPDYMAQNLRLEPNRNIGFYPRG